MKVNKCSCGNAKPYRRAYACEKCWRDEMLSQLEVARAHNPQRNKMGTGSLRLGQRPRNSR